MTEPFHILESTEDGRRVIAPRGELDLSTAAQLEERLRGNTDTVLDLSGLSFIDSTGIRLLILTARRAQQQAWEFTVRHPRPAVLRVIKLVALDQYLRLDSSTSSNSSGLRRAQPTWPHDAQSHATPLNTNPAIQR